MVDRDRAGEGSGGLAEPDLSSDPAVGGVDDDLRMDQRARAAGDANGGRGLAHRSGLAANDRQRQRGEPRRDRHARETSRLAGHPLTQFNAADDPDAAPRANPAPNVRECGSPPGGTLEM